MKDGVKDTTECPLNMLPTCVGPYVSVAISQIINFPPAQYAVCLVGSSGPLRIPAKLPGCRGKSSTRTELLPVHRQQSEN